MSELQRLRISKGLDPVQLAHDSGLNLPSYYDAEHYPDELMCAVEIGKVLKLATLLKVLPTQLLGHTDVSTARSPRLLFDALWKQASSGPHQLARFEEDAGWSVSPLSDDYQTFLYTMLGWCPDCLSDLCQVAELDWKQILNGIYAEHEARP